MAQMPRVRRGQGVAGWAALVGAALSCALGFGAHALVMDGGVEIERSDDAAVEQVGEPEAIGQDDGADALDEQEEALVIVHVDGSVTSPGVYEIASDDVRVGDVVDAAGGLTDDADLSSVNLAARVLDGEKVHIPAEGEETAPVITGSVNPVGSTQDPVVNINTATVEELMVLPGIGEATAAAIVEDRERLGPFSSPEDIMRVSGIGEKKYKRIKDQIRVS